MRAVLIAAAASLALATGVRAQPADPAAARISTVPPIRLKLAAPYAEAYALKTAGIARTSIERRSDAATAAVGFLCGLQDGAGRTGAAAAFGSDPHGRFLGAKLSFAFR